MPQYVNFILTYALEKVIITLTKQDKQSQQDMRKTLSYAKVRIKLEEMLRSSQIGCRLPSETQLATSFGVCRPTVRKAISELAYEGTLQARRGSGTYLLKPIRRIGAQSVRNSAIDLIVPCIDAPNISKIIAGAEDAAFNAGLSLTVRNGRNCRTRILENLSRSIDAPGAGMIVYPFEDMRDPELLELIDRTDEKKIPLVFIDRFIASRPIISILSDNVFGARAASEELLKNGCTKLGLLGFGEWAGNSHYEREFGFNQILSEYGLRPIAARCVKLGNDSRPNYVKAHQEVACWLKDCKKQLDFDGIFCMSGEMAAGAYLALKEAGIEVPLHVALTAYDEYYLGPSPIFDLDLTRIEQPLHTMGEKAVEVLLGLNSPPLPQNRKILIQPRIVLGSSSCFGSSPASLKT